MQVCIALALSRSPVPSLMGNHLSSDVERERGRERKKRNCIEASEEKAESWRGRKGDWQIYCHLYDHLIVIRVYVNLIKYKGREEKG